MKKVILITLASIVGGIAVFIILLSTTNIGSAINPPVQPAHHTTVQHALAPAQQKPAPVHPKVTPQPKSDYRHVDNMYLSSLSIPAEDGTVINTEGTIDTGKTGLAIEVYVKYPTDARMKRIAETIAYELPADKLALGVNVNFYDTPDASDQTLAMIELDPNSWYANGTPVPSEYTPVGGFYMNPIG